MKPIKKNTTRKKRMSIKKRKQSSAATKRTLKWGSKKTKKTKKTIIGGGKFEEDYTVDISSSIVQEPIINNFRGDELINPKFNDGSMLGKSTTLEHNIYLQNMIENILNDVNCSNKLLIFIKALKSIPDKTNYLSKDTDTFLHYYIYNELIAKYEGDDIMDCFVINYKPVVELEDSAVREYDVNYSVDNYTFLYNYNLCDLYLKYVFDELTKIVSEYNLTNTATQITEFNHTFQNLYDNPNYYNIYDVSDLKKVNNILLTNEDIETKIKKYFYDVDYRNVKLEEIEIRIPREVILTNQMMTNVLSEKSKTILELVKTINGFVKESKTLQLKTPTSTSTSTPTPSPPTQVELTVINEGDINIFFTNLIESSESQDENPISRAVMYLLTISEGSMIRTELSKFEKMLNIKLEESAIIKLIGLINNYQKSIYGSNNSVYMSNPASVSVNSGGAKSAPTESVFDTMKNELSSKHIVYDNAHDFDYGIYVGSSPLCRDLCDYSIVARSAAIETYKTHYGSNILGTDSTIKSHIYSLTFDKFMPYLATVDFVFDKNNQANTLKSVQNYIRKEILQITELDALSKSNVAFCHDMGGMFTEIMIKGKLSLSTDNDKDIDEKKSKDFIDLHNSTLLKTWDSSTGGFNIGNQKIKAYVLKSSSNGMTAMIAYNLQALVTMTKYFAIDYYGEVKSLFANDASLAYIPVLQSTSLNKTEFNVELFLINLNVAKDIYTFIQDTYKTNNQDGKKFIDALQKIDLLKKKKELFTVEGFLSSSYSSPGNIRRLIANVRYPTKKYSVNSILKALKLPINSKRSGNPNKDSIKSLEDLLKVDVLNTLTANNKNKYLFMLKHSGDTCQGIQTGLAADVFNLVLKDDGMNFTNSILYTEDALAFCNAVFNGNNAMTITVKNNVVSVCHTRNTLSFVSFAPSVKKIYDNLTSANANKSAAYKSEVAYFNQIMNVINNSSTPKPPSSDETIELIKRISEYNEYFSLKKVFDELSQLHDESAGNFLYGEIIDFGKYEQYFDFNSIYLLVKGTTGKDLTTNKLRFNKFINTYNSFNQITVKNVESFYKSTVNNDGETNRNTQIATFENSTVNDKNDDTVFYKQFNVMIDDIVKNSDSAWIETIFKNILTTFNGDLMELLYHVQELREQYNKADKLKTLVKSQDKIHSLLNNHSLLSTTNSVFDKTIETVFITRLNNYRNELKNEMEYKDGKRKNKSTIEFVATARTVKYNCTFNVFKLIKCVRTLGDTKIVGSISFDTIRDIIKQIDECLATP